MLGVQLRGPQVKAMGQLPKLRSSSENVPVCTTEPNKAVILDTSWVQFRVEG